MRTYKNIIVLILVNVVIQCNAQIEIQGSCPDEMGSKLPTNWLAMAGKWYEVMRVNSPLQVQTTCGSIDVSNVDRFIHINHNYKNMINQKKSNPSIFELNSDPSMKLCFMPGITKQLTLMGTDYLNLAAFSYCAPKTTKTSNMYFWIFCRKNHLTQTSNDLASFTFKLRKAENMLPYLQYTDQSSCPA